jgi:uncharacterized protein involved in exopolysaccharide biosynthesis
LTPGTGLWDAICRHPLLILMPVLLLTAAGIAIGMVRHPIYTAESQLVVGKVNPNSPALGGFVQTTTALATAFSRSIDADGVITPVAAKMHADPLTVAARLAATPIPQSPVVRVIATGSTAATAVQSANLAGPQLVRYVTALNARNPDGPRLLGQYRTASVRVARAQAHVDKLNRLAAGHPSPELQSRIDSAQADRGAAALVAQSAGTAYQLSQQGQASTDLMSVLALASSAQSDRTRIAELTGFAGLIVGIFLGCGLAWTRERRLVRRRGSAIA